MSLHPEIFDTSKCIFAVQPVSMGYMTQQILESTGITEICSLKDVDDAFKERTGFGHNDMCPKKFIKDLQYPIMYSGVKADKMTSPKDLEEMYEMTLVQKQLFWIEGYQTDNRFDGYSYWTKHP